MTRLRSELEAAMDAKRFLEDEVESLRSAGCSHPSLQSSYRSYDCRAEVQHLSEGAGEGESGKLAGDIFEVETVASLREKV